MPAVRRFARFESAPSGWAAEATAELSDAAVTAQNRVTGTTPTLRVGDLNARGESCGFGCACDVWSSVLGLGESSLHRREPRRDLSARQENRCFRSSAGVNSILAVEFVLRESVQLGKISSMPQPKVYLGRIEPPYRQPERKPAAGAPSREKACPSKTAPYLEAARYNGFEIFLSMVVRS
jgi:hypothetical protein